MSSTNQPSGVGAFSRIYMGGTACVIWFIAMSEPKSMLAAAAAVSGAGTALIWLLLATGIMALADAVINDFMPDKYHWRAALNQRHFIMSGMAFCYVAQLYVAFYSLRSPGLMVYYLWNAAIIMFIAFVDAHQRSKDATCVVLRSS